MERNINTIEKINTMDKMVHLAAQYLAMAGNSFLEIQPDGSQSNLGFCKFTTCLQTRPLNDNGDVLLLNYDNFTLEWKSEKLTNRVLLLDGKSHGEILKWISKTSIEAGIILPYKYTFNENLPYPKLNDSFTFNLLDSDRLKQLSSYRKLAQTVLEDVVERHHLSAEVRIWPFDFDTSVYALINSKTDVAIGFGMATPDSQTSGSDHYLYTAGWHGLDNIKTVEFPELKNGKWHTSYWSGAIMPLESVNKNSAANFFGETIQVFKNQYLKEVG